MSYASNASQEYLKNAVLTAGPEQLQLMLLDGALRFAARGLEAIQAKDIEAGYHALERAQRIVLQLHAGLRREINPELVDRMAALYHFIYGRLVEGCLKRDAQAVEEALKILRYQRETWLLLMERINRTASAPAAAPANAVTPANSAAPPNIAASPAKKPVLAPALQAEPTPTLNLEG